ncbi:MAG: MCE family protein [Deltaproteobacteria bacterium]|nr:MCE family protein [Deltaproteobacteria bacterium]MBW1952392.1 MCE family protein [Deltaproteobacteria bacterium]MBW1985903.1 MCE family protein [Deltaproteobacteria bacterium]MBW2133663.1 MCE family protein [Deltaproteobacteria bacterium]
MDEGFTRSEKLAGLFLFLMLLVTVAALLAIGQGKAWFKSQQTYLVKFKQGYNLTPGSAVKMFNTEIGKVTDLHISRIMDQTQVVITIKVLAEYADLIRQDSVAEVQSPGLFGSEYLEISPGSSGYPPVAEYGTIPSQERKTFADYLEEFKPEESLRRAKQILINLAYLTEQLKTHERKLLTSVNKFNEVMASILEAKGSLGKLMMQTDFYGRLGESLTKIENVVKDAQSITSNLKDTTSQMPALAKSVREEVQTVKSILADIKQGSQEFPELMGSASEAARGGTAVVDALKANPLIRLTLPKQPDSETIHLEPRNVP